MKRFCALSLTLPLLAPIPLRAAPPAVTPVIAAAARPLPIPAVRLTGGPLKRAQDLDAEILLALDPDRMMAGYRLRAGLEPKAPGYGGWDSVNGKQLTGHLAGHYLSAVSLMYAATGDPRFKERTDRLVREMKEVQDRRGNGYLGALTDSQGTDAMLIFEQVAAGNIRSGGFDLNGMWSPWYTLHKTYAGLRDAYRHTGNGTALDLEIRFSEWAERLVSRMTDAQVQRMLNTEFGGMNEVFVDLYVDTGDRRWLDLSYRFEHHAFTEPLKRHQDILGGQHGNTQVPKMIGSLDRFAATGDPGDGYAAAFFWDRVVQHHSYATGGHGKDEYFGEPDQLNDRVDGRTAETCNVYNMLKLTRDLFALRPDPEYADFHERALFNHILGSQDPEEGWACYMVPVGRGVQREYERNMTDGGFTCCTGSSLESHALHADGVYYTSPGRLWVNLYAPSTAEWSEAGLTLTQETDFPEGESAEFKLTLREPREFTLALRRPFWVGEAFSLQVNGERLPDEQVNPSTYALPGRGRRGGNSLPPVSSYVLVSRAWHSGDSVTVTLPKTLRLESLPDNPRRAAILWGPLVLAGDLGPEGERGRGGQSPAHRDVPALVAAERPPEDWIQPIADRPNCFRTDGVGRDADVTLVPFYRLHRRTYAAYWDLFTPAEWEQESARIAAAEARQRRLEAATVGFVQPGEMQAERDANMQGEATRPDRLMGRAGRRGSAWFSFDIAVDPARPMALIVTYNRDEWQERTFELLVDGVRVGEQTIPRRGPLEFFDVRYPVPAELVRDKSKVTVRFQAVSGNEIGAVYGLRMIRADVDLDAETPDVGAVPADIRERFDLDSFYQKHLPAGPLPIVSSTNTTDYALREAGYIVQKMLGHRPDVLEALADRRARVVVMAYNEYTTDLPEQRDMQPKAYWDSRARGLGGRICSCAEENLLAYPGDPYSTENIFIHEFAHVIHGVALRQLDPTFQERLKTAYAAALERGLWKNTYAAVDAAEYWAEGVQDWFDNNRENDSLHNHVNTRAELKDYDPALAALCAEVFGENPWRYRKPADREPSERAHFGDYDPARAPRFRWRQLPLPEKPRVQLETALGNIELELDAQAAPVTVSNFLHYSHQRLYNDGRFFRTVTVANPPDDAVPIEVVQAEASAARAAEFLPPIALERTRDTGLHHLDGTISMARAEPDTAQHSFFICIGDQPELDFGGRRNPDGQGFAAFGRVVKGMELIRRIHAAPAEGQNLTPPIGIQRAIRLN